MIRNFTIQRMITTAFMSMAMVLFTMQLFAQNINTITVNAPGSIAGDYTAVLAEFGQQLTSDLNGAGVLIDDGTDPTSDGCEPGATNVVGKIAFIDRGVCQFGAKALAAENAGALAVVICNNVDGEPFVMIPGDDGANVNIPTVMVSKADCDVIRVAFADGEIDATLRYLCVPPVYGPEVIWGRNTGEGDFNGGLNDWTVEKPASVDVDTWHWDASGFTGGFFGSAQIVSATQCNGAIVVSSDLLDNNNSSNTGSGPCPADCVTSLVSPVIDLSAGDPSKGFFIQFTQRFRNFLSGYNLILSKNGGITYPDTLVLNGDAVLASLVPVNETVKIPLVGYEGVQNLQFKFEYTGNYYYWIIDDVSITNESYVDMQVNSNWYAAPPQWRTPASQVSEMPFLIDIFNNGNLDAQNVQVHVDVYDEGGNSVYNQTKDYGVVDAYTLNENNVFDAGAFTPPAIPGVYNGFYSITAESPDPDFPDNLLTTNDSIPFSLEVTENTFSNIPGEPDGNTMRPMTDGSIFSDGGGSFSAATCQGAVFYVPNGTDHTVGNITFGVTDEETTPSGFIHVRLYRWLGDLDGSDAMEPGERVIVGANTVIVDTAANQRLINVPVFAADAGGNAIPGESVTLTDNSQYMLVLLAEPLVPGVQLDVLGADNSNGTNRNFNHFASNMAMDSTFTDRNPGSYFEVMASGGVAEFEGIAADFYDINELWAEIVVYDRTTDVEEINEQIGLTAFPNPASDWLNVNIALENASELELEILSLDGKLVQKDKFPQLKTGTVTLNVSTLNTGVYVLNVRTEEGVRSQKIMIQR